MKTLFEIGNLIHDEPGMLFMEIGETYLSISLIDGDAKLLRGLRIFTYSLFELEETLLKVIESLDVPNRHFTKVVISPAFPQTLLIPNKIFKPDDAILENTYGLEEVANFSDHIGEWQLVNSYAVPRVVCQAVNKAFPGATYLHAYSPLLKIFNGFTSGQQVAVYFVHKQFRVVVKKDQNIQLVQTYAYTTPMDVVYFILKICLEFSLAQEDTQIVISGFIEQNSALYKELYSYFLNLHFANISFLSLPEGDHPGHYFTSINNLAACVL